MDNIITAEFWRSAAATAGVTAWAVAKILIFFFVVRFAAYRLIDRLLDSVVSRETKGPTPVSAGRLRTLCGLIKSIVFYVLIFISGVMILRVFDIDPAPVLTAAGVVGLAIGFGAQKLVRDIISGFFVVLENQYSVGEYITVGAVTGTVVELGMRTTQLRDDIGKLVIISNGDVTQVINHSRGPISATLEVSVAADSDMDRVRAVLDAVGDEVYEQVEGVATPPRADGLTAVDASKVTIRISGEVRPGRQGAVQSALRERIHARLAKEEIKLI